MEISAYLTVRHLLPFILKYDIRMLVQEGVLEEEMEYHSSARGWPSYCSLWKIGAS